jgi:hypothetical protein
MPENYWTHKAPETPTAPPPDNNMSRADWLTLTPGMRREIWREWERRGAPIGE